MQPLICAKMLTVHQRYVERAGVKGALSVGHLVLLLCNLLSVLKQITVSLSMV